MVYWKILTFFLCVAFSTNAVSNESRYIGIAKDETGAILYKERHTLYKENGILKSSETAYFLPDGSKKIATLKSDYSKSLALPTYQFIDLVRGYKEGIKFEDGAYFAYYQKKGAPEEKSPIEKGDMVFGGQGWHYYLTENFETLEKDKVELKLVLPGLLKKYDFVITKTKESKARLTSDFKIDNWLISLFAPKMRLTYDRQTRNLVQYQGISNILDKDGEKQEVVIRYEYI